jgi:NAD(P)-dependent dehydrogenase (short-subunit alcohol dehydrogenase family)
MTTLIAGISGGIGLAMASHELSRHPEVRIIGLSRNASQSEEVLKLQSSYPERVTLIDTNVGDPDHLKTAFENHIPAEARIHKVIFAIGILHGPDLFPEKRLEDIRPQSMMHSYETNILGFLLLVQALIPWLRHKDPKLIAAISAKVGSIGDNEFGGWYAYRCSKAALNMAVRTLAIETRRRLKPATVVALHPGTTETNLTAPFQQSLARLQVHSPVDTANNLWNVLDGLTPEESGSFLNWDGTTLPW